MKMNLTSTSTDSPENRHFGLWGNLALSRKLLLAFGVLFAFSVIIAGITLWGLNRTTTAYEQTINSDIEIRRVSSQLSIDLLTARRNEKNFLLRWKSEGYDTARINYLVSFKAGIAAMRDDIKQLRALAPVLASTNIGGMTQAQYEKDLAILTQNTDAYEQSFNAQVTALVEEGPDEKSGMQLTMRNAAHSIEAGVVGKAGLEPLAIAYLEIRRNEKDYLARGDQSYIDNVHSFVGQLKTEAAASGTLDPAKKTELANLADEYQKDFDIIVAKNKEINDLDTAAINAARAVEPLVTQFGDLGKQLAAQETATAQSDSTQIFTISIVTVFIVLAVSVVLALTLSRQITNPILSLTNTAQEISGGKFDIQAQVNSADEVGTLAQTFNIMTVRLGQAFADVNRRAAELATVAEVGTATATILQTDRLLQEVVDLTKERFNLYHSHIYLLDEAGENLVLASGAGEPGRQMKAKGLSIPLNREQSLVASAARERKGVTVNDVTQAPDFLPNPLLPDTRSELATPMIVGGKVIGVFDVQSDVVGRFTESDINIQTTLASQVATSIQNVRSFEQSKAEADLESLVNAIGQKIQRTTTVEDTLQTAIREIGLALGATRVSANIAGRSNGNNEISRN
jgi:putative methionine-R-sulfoxide reductase with GAF domain/CHASE3 domain sensor protein